MKMDKVCLKEEVFENLLNLALKNCGSNLPNLPNLPNLTNKIKPSSFISIGSNTLSADCGTSEYGCCPDSYTTRIDKKGSNCSGVCVARGNIKNCGTSEFGCYPKSCIPRTCPAGSYCPDNPSLPMKCPAGTYCPAGSSSPMKCPAGTYSSSIGAISSTSCKNCPEGTYCTTGSSLPMKCPVNSQLVENKNCCYPSGTKYKLHDYSGLRNYDLPYYDPQYPQSKIDLNFKCCKSDSELVKSKDTDQNKYPGWTIQECP